MDNRQHGLKDVSSKKQGKFWKLFDKFFGIKEESNETPSIKPLMIRVKTKHSKNKKGKCKGCFGKPRWMKSEKVLADINKPKAGNIARDLRRAERARLLAESKGGK